MRNKRKPFFLATQPRCETRGACLRDKSSRQTEIVASDSVAVTTNTCQSTGAPRGASRRTTNPWYHFILHLRHAKNLAYFWNEYLTRCFGGNDLLDCGSVHCVTVHISTGVLTRANWCWILVNAADKIKHLSIFRPVTRTSTHWLRRARSHRDRLCN